MYWPVRVVGCAIQWRRRRRRRAELMERGARLTYNVFSKSAFYNKPSVVYEHKRQSYTSASECFLRLCVCVCVRTIVSKESVRLRNESARAQRGADEN